VAEERAKAGAILLNVGAAPALAVISVHKDQASGTKTYFIQYRNAEGSTRRLVTLGFLSKRSHEILGIALAADVRA
jgi:hypothetical protein